MFTTEDAATWVRRLDAVGIAAEACADAPGVVVFDDDDLKDRSLVTSCDHPVLGAMELAGMAP